MKWRIRFLYLLTLSVVTLLGSAAAVTATPSRSQAKPALSGQTSEDLYALQQGLQREAESVQASPARKLSVDEAKKSVVVEFGPGDSNAYRKWLNDIGDRYGYLISIKYVSDSALAPTEEALRSVNDVLTGEYMSLPGKPTGSIGVNLLANAVEITYDASASPEFRRWAASAESRFGKAVHVIADAEPIAATDATKGGYGISGQAGTKDKFSLCTIGFNVIKNGEYHFVTAGHCTWNGYDTDNSNPVSYWYNGQKASCPNFFTVGNHGYFWEYLSCWLAPADAVYLGTRSGSVILPPDGDMAVIKYSSMASSTTKYGVVYKYSSGDEDIDGIGVPTQGDWVCASGITTHLRCQYITSACVAVTIDYGPPNGLLTIACMTSVPVPTEPGDSGGPLFRLGKGLGVQAGGNTFSSTGPSYSRVFSMPRRNGA